MEFASQSLLSDNLLKVANMKAFEEEMRKLRQAIEAKDEQLRQVQEN
jgi:queuine/archaeosine tRNA-ribosyltransferase